MHVCGMLRGSMARKKVSFIATKYQNKPARIHFYTKEGKQVAFDTVKRAPTKKSVSFYVDTRSGHKK